MEPMNQATRAASITLRWSMVSRSLHRKHTVQLRALPIRPKNLDDVIVRQRYSFCFIISTCLSPEGVGGTAHELATGKRFQFHLMATYLAFWTTQHTRSFFQCFANGKPGHIITIPQLTISSGTTSCPKKLRMTNDLRDAMIEKQNEPSNIG